MAESRLTAIRPLIRFTLSPVLLEIGQVSGRGAIRREHTRRCGTAVVTLSHNPSLSKASCYETVLPRRGLHRNPVETPVWRLANQKHCLLTIHLHRGSKV